MPGSRYARMAPAADVDPLQHAGLEQLRDGLLRLRGPEAVVVAQVRLRRDAERAGCAQHQRPGRRLGVRRVRGEDLGGQHPLGQVVEPLEVHPRPGGERAGAEQVLADPLDVRARPPRGALRPGRARPQRRLQRPGTHRTQLLDRGQQLVDQPRLPVGERLVVPPPARTLGARQQQRPVGDRQQAGLVRPVLHQHPGTARRVRPGGVVHQPRVVRPEPAEDRHVVGADRDVHRVELQQPDPGEQPREVAAGGRARRPRVGEPLRRQRGAAGGGGADHVDGVPGCGVPRRDAASRHRHFPAPDQRRAAAYYVGVVPSIQQIAQAQVVGVGLRCVLIEQVRRHRHGGPPRRPGGGRW